ncbi:hypothetical protein [Alloacidobacterium sp.]|uniref:hypothetical protein n=1 Tax=Alloacidobacterium sp. TaxID=2951999 RepID=UPI002D5FBE99|nr:hypothetical protein [Alloacidobacterium sp.]HYK37795.1 hypothetical protein [Alloacidobacterium sp.]
MQRIDKPRRRRSPGHGPVCERRQRATLDSIGTHSAPWIGTLARAFGQALPTFDRVPTEYKHEVNAELLYELCAALVEAGLGSPGTWQGCGGDAVVFARQSIMNSIGRERAELLGRNVEYHLQMSDVFERDGYGSSLGNGQLAVTIDCCGAGYLKIGRALYELEKQAEGLGAAFYWTLIHALYRVMRIYDHIDAVMYEEMLIESANQDEEENRSQYEFPEVEKALPECIQKTLNEKWSIENRRLLHAHNNGPHRAWIDRLRKLQRLSVYALNSRGSLSKTAITMALRSHRYLLPSRKEMPLLPVSTRRVNTCSKARRSRHSVSSFLRRRPTK